MRIALAVLLCCVSGCGIAVNVARNPAAALRPPRGAHVFMTRELVEGPRVEVLGTIEVHEQWYGAVDGPLARLADEARALGADAVVGLRTWFAPTWFALAAPHASGTAIAWRAAVDLRGFPGRNY